MLYIFDALRVKALLIILKRVLHHFRAHITYDSKRYDLHTYALRNEVALPSKEAIYYQVRRLKGTFLKYDRLRNGDSTVYSVVTQFDIERSSSVIWPVHASYVHELDMIIPVVLPRTQLHFLVLWFSRYTCGVTLTVGGSKQVSFRTVKFWQEYLLENKRHLQRHLLPTGRIKFSRSHFYPPPLRWRRWFYLYS